MLISGKLYYALYIKARHIFIAERLSQTNCTTFIAYIILQKYLIRQGTAHSHYRSAIKQKSHSWFDDRLCSRIVWDR
jgi:hypothetical protein